MTARSLRRRAGLAAARHGRVAVGLLSLAAAAAFAVVGSAYAGPTVAGVSPRAAAAFAVAGALCVLAGATVVLARPDGHGDGDGAAAGVPERIHGAEHVSVGSVERPIRRGDVRVRDLEALVDAAAAAKRRVVHDPDRDLYAVVGEDMMYYHSPAIDGAAPSAAGADGDERGAPRDGGSPVTFERIRARGPPDPWPGPAGGATLPKGGTISWEARDGESWTEHVSAARMAEDAPERELGGLAEPGEGADDPGERDGSEFEFGDSGETGSDDGRETGFVFGDGDGTAFEFGNGGDAPDDATEAGFRFGDPEGPAGG